MSPTTVDWTSIDQREAILLAPYAMRSANSRGRRYPEPDHPYRGPFQRDRDRVLHSSAFRRLSGKMQVFTGDMGDYHRTRLTHTHEVSSIARTIARALRLNEDLVEALALVHDIGHPPFGHAGEDALNECLEEHDGFSHNQFALTIVEELEIRFNSFPGLNLTYEMLSGQTARVDKSAPGPRPLLEVQLVDAADSTTYDAHDTDDAIKLALVTLDEMSQVPLVRESLEHIRREYTALDQRWLRKAVVHRLIDSQVSDILGHSSRELADRGFSSVEEACHSDFLIGPSPEMSEKKAELERFLYRQVYRHPRLMQVRSSAQQRLREMVQELERGPEKLPPRHQQRIDQVGLRRAVVEYIAGMTDHYCDQVYRQLFGGRAD